jgi:tRNA G18 (ribose-2'-O)-methylase SpoU
MKREIVLVISNVRSAHNVGSLLRSADGLGVNRVLICGFSPYPSRQGDARLPHIAQKTGRSIAKTSLGAETSLAWEYHEDILGPLKELAGQGFLIAALEQTDRAVNLNGFIPPQKTALIVGNEIQGVDKSILDLAQVHLAIPMLGGKESFNVSVAGAMALYQLRYS